MRFLNHYHENAPSQLRGILRSYDTSDHKTALWNSFVDSGLSEINDDDCSILPRILPGQYLPVIRRTAHDICLFSMRLLSLPEKEIRSILPSGPIRDFLIEDLEVLRHRNGRITGSFRFDMAIVGAAKKNNPPKLLEINEIGFDGLARSSFFQKTMFELMPEIRSKVFALDTARAEVHNMQRLGRKIARFHYDCYNWDEEYLIRTARAMNSDLRLISPRQLKCAFDQDEFPLLGQKPVTFANGKVRVAGGFQPDAVQLSYAFELEDYVRGQKFYRQLVRGKTPQYGPFLSGLVASKMILVLFSDASLRRRFLGSSSHLENSILPAFPYADHEKQTRAEASRLVIKHTDGFGGQQVFMGKELRKNLKKIKPREHSHWIVQERTRLNTIGVHGILSRPRSVISDLGVFVHYDWARGKFQNFELGGFITRATNHSLKVNVSGGGIQVPVMFSK